MSTELPPSDQKLNVSIVSLSGRIEEVGDFEWGRGFVIRVTPWEASPKGNDEIRVSGLDKRQVREVAECLYKHATIHLVVTKP